MGISVANARNAGEKDSGVRLKDSKARAHGSLLYISASLKWEGR